MEALKPADVVYNMVQAPIAKATPGPLDLLVRALLFGALLGFATSQTIGATTQTGGPLVGALMFPASFMMIVLLGVALMTGSFAVVPDALLANADCSQ
jgi:formate transporter